MLGLDSRSYHFDSLTHPILPKCNPCVVNPLVCEQGTTSVLTQVKGRTGASGSLASGSLGPVTGQLRLMYIEGSPQLYYYNTTLLLRMMQY